MNEQVAHKTLHMDLSGNGLELRQRGAAHGIVHLGVVADVLQPEVVAGAALQLHRAVGHIVGGVIGEADDDLLAVPVDLHLLIVDDPVVAYALVSLDVHGNIGVRVV